MTQQAYTYWDYVRLSGTIGYIQVAISVLSLGVVLDRVWFWLRRGGRLDAAVRGAVVAAFRAGNDAGVESLLEGNSSPEAQAVRHLVRNRGAADDVPLDLIIGRESTETCRWLQVLDVNAGVAPMLGILGTVVGIMRAFTGIAGRVPDTTVMVSGISLAMATTAVGLVVALLSMVPYNILAAKAHRSQAQLAELLQECWSGCHGPEVVARINAATAAAPQGQVQTG